MTFIPHAFWRDRTGREVDALLDFPGARVPLEAKAGETLSPSFFKGLGFYRALQQEAGSRTSATTQATTGGTPRGLGGRRRRAAS